MPPAPAPATRSALAANESRLKMSLYTFLDVPHPSTDVANYNRHEIVRALTHQGITHFRRDFLSMSERDIRDLLHLMPLILRCLTPQFPSSTKDVSSFCSLFTITVVPKFRRK
jgi:hypothetical protein